MNIEQVIVSGISSGAIYALIAIGFVIIYNVTGIINFSQGHFTMLGALIVVSLVGSGLNILIASIITVIIVMAICAIIYATVLYPLRDSKNQLSSIMVTMGIGIVITAIALIIWGTDDRALAPFTKGQPISFFRAILTFQDLWILGTCASIILLMFYLFDRTYFGMSIRACMSNQTASKLMGIRTQRMALISFALSGGVAAIGGIVMAPTIFASYNMGLMLGLKGFVAAVLGGLTGAPAAIVGGFTLGLIESLGAGYISTEYKDLIAFGVLILIMIVRPGGILGKHSVKKV